MISRFLPPSGDLVLRDVHLPPSPPWWPPAPGWWVLAGFFCVAMVVAALQYRRRRRAHLRSQRILDELQMLEQRHREDDIAYASSVHQILRRAARRYAEDAHQLQGERWREVLACVPVNDTTVDTLMTLEARMYQPHANFDRASVQQAAKRWLKAVLFHEKLLVRKVRHA